MQCSSRFGDPRLHEPLEPGKRREKLPVALLEERTPGGIDGFGVLEVLLEELSDITGVEAGRLETRHRRLVPEVRTGRCP